jgi:hypothetical protein
MTLQPLNRSLPPPERSRTRVADRMTAAQWRRPFGTVRTFGTARRGADTINAIDAGPRIAKVPTVERSRHYGASHLHDWRDGRRIRGFLTRAGLFPRSRPVTDRIQAGPSLVLGETPHRPPGTVQR